MNPYIAAAIFSVFSVVFKLHVAIHAAGLMVSVSVPLAIMVTLAAAITIGLYLIVRELTGFRILGSWA